LFLEIRTMVPAQPTILEKLDRLIGRLLRAPATAAAARVVLWLPFWWLDFSGGVAEMATLGMEPAWLFNVLTILVQLGGSLLVILNLRTWLGAGALGVFTVLATVLAHQFWTNRSRPRVQYVPRASGDHCRVSFPSSVSVVFGADLLIVNSNAQSRLDAG
jgi:transmembrane protein